MVAKRTEQAGAPQAREKYGVVVQMEKRFANGLARRANAQAGRCDETAGLGIA